MHRTPTPTPPRPGRRVTLHDVAQYCGVSICTVNKALGNKGALRPETRQAVQEAARRLGYRPNRIAQTLVRRPITLGVIYPRGYWPSYYGPLLAAVRQGVEAMEDHHVRADFRPVASPRSAAAYQRAIFQLLEEKVDALVLCPGPVDPPGAAWERIAQSKIPLALLGNDITAAVRLTCVTNDSARCGRLAAELLGKIAPGRPLAVIVGSRELADHAEKVRGFEAEAEELGLPLAGVYRIARRPGADVSPDPPPPGRAPRAGRPVHRHGQRRRGLPLPMGERTGGKGGRGGHRDLPRDRRLSAEESGAIHLLPEHAQAGRHGRRGVGPAPAGRPRPAAADSHPALHRGREQLGVVLSGDLMRTGLLQDSPPLPLGEGQGVRACKKRTNKPSP